ncbi:MAG TPA: hypothetical protein VIK37_02760 [Candidatus Saccharimonadales bacterium]
MDQATAKQQVIERLKQANNILVTVSNNPSVDQLSACIGMTLFLNKLEKHATAVYSGQTPPAIEFLQPEKTLESTTDSLRDFIISLDKAKADKLRYKVEDKFVRIYITPYRTSISQKDLVFSEGDFNVDVVLALGVRDKAQLDAAITQHGRILHDASVISVNAGQEKAPDIGQINWQEPTASSLCEMLVSISEAFGTGLIDSQMATAFLTGIVAETQRFSNPKTSPKVMTMAAQLMAAGANQQLIVSKLEPPPPPEATKTVRLPKSPKSPPSDTLRVSHEAGQPDSGEIEVKPDEIHIDKEGNIVSQPEPESEPPKGEPALLPVSEPVLPPPPDAVTPAASKVITPPSSEPPAQAPPKPAAGLPYEPLKSQPLVLPVEAEPTAPPHTKPNLNFPESRSKTGMPETKPAPEPHELLDPIDHKPSISPPFSADTQPFWYDPENSMPLDPLSEAPRPNDAILNQVASTPTFPTPTEDSARSAVNAALAAVPFNPAIEGPIKALNASPLPSEKIVSPPSEKPASPPDQPAPPPVPPPLKLDSGTLIPTTPNPIPVAANANGPTLNLPKVL